MMARLIGPLLFLCIICPSTAQRDCKFVFVMISCLSIAVVYAVWWTRVQEGLSESKFCLQQETDSDCQAKLPICTFPSPKTDSIITYGACCAF